MHIDSIMSPRQPPPSSEQVQRYLETVEAIRRAVQTAGASGIPSGHVYAALSGRCTLAAFEQMVSALCGGGVVEKRGDLLVCKRAIR